MIRGTTPEFILNVDADLTGKTVFVTIKQPNAKVTITGDDLSIVSDGESSTIAVRLTQRQTLDLRVGPADVQVRFIDGNGIASATDIQTINVTRVLLERVIEHA